MPATSDHASPTIRGISNFFFFSSRSAYERVKLLIAWSPIVDLPYRVVSLYPLLANRLGYRYSMSSIDDRGDLCTMLTVVCPKPVEGPLTDDRRMKATRTADFLSAPPSNLDQQRHHTRPIVKTLMNSFFRLQAAIAVVLFLCAASSAVAFGQNEPVASRGGDALVCDAKRNHSNYNRLGTARKEITNFLESSNDTGKFHVQGWRWHTMSLLREADRLRQLARRWERDSRNENDFSALKQATDYVVGFNMKGLHKIENSLFFPWAREKIKAMTELKVSQAFGTVMDQLEKDRRTIEKIGTAMVSSVVMV